MFCEQLTLMENKFVRNDLLSCNYAFENYALSPLFTHTYMGKKRYDNSGWTDYMETPLGDEKLVCQPTYGRQSFSAV